jgi:poly(hydroxyalkanoate) granule-associated protein
MARKIVKTRNVAAKKPDAARAVWLASLGAVALTRKRSDALLLRLGDEGRSLRANSLKAARDARKKAKAKLTRALAPLQRNVESNAKKFGAVVEHGVGLGLARLGVPSKADIQELTHRVSSLSRQLRAANR